MKIKGNPKDIKTKVTLNSLRKNKIKVKPNCSKLNKEGKCRSDCCQNTPMSEKLIEAHMHLLPSDTIIRKSKVKDMYTVTCASTDRCAFLSEDLKCKIYEVRPTVCKSFGVVPVFDCICYPENQHLTEEDLKELYEQENEVFFTLGWILNSNLLQNPDELMKYLYNQFK